MDEQFHTEIEVLGTYTYVERGRTVLFRKPRGVACLFQNKKKSTKVNGDLFPRLSQYIDVEVGAGSAQKRMRGQENSAPLRKLLLYTSTRTENTAGTTLWEVVRVLRAIIARKQCNH